MTDQDNTITALRGELFATIRALRDPANPMDVNRAKAVAEVAGRIIDSAKAETEAVKAFGRGAVPVSGFIGTAPKPDTLDHQGKAGQVHQHQTTDASGKQITYETRDAVPRGPQASI